LPVEAVKCSTEEGSSRGGGRRTRGIPGTKPQMVPGLGLAPSDSRAPSEPEVSEPQAKLTQTVLRPGDFERGQQGRRIKDSGELT